MFSEINMLTREISRSEVNYHDSPDDCWLIIRNIVYDVTPFLMDHPGSMEVLIEYAGSDATDAFESVGHSMIARAMCDNLRVGTLPAHEQTSYGSERITEAKVITPPRNK